MSDVIENKIESIRKCVARIESVRPASVELLLENVDAQDILCLNLERSVQMAVDIATYLLATLEVDVPETMADAFRGLQGAGVIDEAIATKMAKAVGFRNIAIHTYKNIDWAVVFSIASLAPDDFREFVRQVVAWEDGLKKE